MAFTATAVGSALAKMVREDIYPTVEDLLPTEVDPVFDEIETTSTGVGMSDSGISREWRVYHTFSTGLAGQLKWANPDGEQVNKSADIKHTLFTRATNHWPAASQVPMKNVFQRTMQLARGYGNMVMPTEILRMDRLTDALMNYAAENVKAVAKNIALQQANAFFATTNSQLATVLAVTAGGTDGSDTYVTVTITGGRIRSFMDGMLVDIRAASTGNLRHQTSPWVVDGVDYLGGTVRFVTADNLVIDSVGNVNVSATDLICLADTLKTGATMYGGPMGLESWIKSSGTIFLGPDGTTGGISLSNYPTFKSLVTNVSAALDELTLNQAFAKFWDAYGLPLDTIITTRGVIEKFAEQPLLGGARQTYDRTAKALRMVAGRAEVKYEYEGSTYSWFASLLCAPGYLYGIKRRGNIVRYVPPTIPGSKTKGTDYGAAVEFVAPAMGYKDIWMPVYTTDASLTDTCQAPFVTFYQMAAKTPQSIKLTGLTEAY